MTLIGPGRLLGEGFLKECLQSVRFAASKVREQAHPKRHQRTVLRRFVNVPDTSICVSRPNPGMNFPRKFHKVYRIFMTFDESDLAPSRATKLINAKPNPPNHPMTKQPGDRGRRRRVMSDGVQLNQGFAIMLGAATRHQCSCTSDRRQRDRQWLRTNRTAIWARMGRRPFWIVNRAWGRPEPSTRAGKLRDRYLPRGPGRRRD